MTAALRDPATLVVAAAAGVVSLALGVAWPLAALAAASTVLFRAVLAALPVFRERPERGRRPAPPPSPQRQRSTRDKLTQRELEVAKAVARGLTDKQIAHELGMEPRTVESHIRTIKTKIDVEHRAQIAAWAVAAGVVDPLSVQEHVRGGTGN
ncbi:MAG TPA: helix-turn-helix transcriptional regulator [Candidatus Limnocylindria bacterium]|nr:helix-turn-helix transcriptional regulator [Candidatus Limnocylindria bacterium]